MAALARLAIKGLSFVAPLVNRFTQSPTKIPAPRDNNGQDYLECKGNKLTTYRVTHK